MFLKKLRDRFVGRHVKEENSPSEAKKSNKSENRLFIGHLRDVLDMDRSHPAADYEPSWVFGTRDCLFWAWRRAGECFKDWFEETNGYKEAYALMHS